MVSHKTQDRNRGLRLFKSPRKATFLSRPNRFLVRCALGGRTVSAFLPNPGRLAELLLPGCRLYLVEVDGPTSRKTRYTAVAVDRASHPIILHTHRTNAMARYLIERDLVPGLEGARVARAEVRVGRSRLDFLLSRGQGDEKILLEVKSCTLVGHRVAMFPDAVTERGARHLRELARTAELGTRSAVLFIVHWPRARIFMPDYHTDLAFARTMLECRAKIEVLAVSTRVSRGLRLLPETEALEIPWDVIEREARDRGSYLVLLRLRRNRTIQIGRLGRVRFGAGYYIYVGSAMANLTKRMARHRRLRKRLHWHIDSLRQEAELVDVLPIRSSDRLECDLARAVDKISNWSIPDFGSSDCSCSSHLFAFTESPLLSPGFHGLLQHFRMDRLFGPSV